MRRGQGADGFLCRAVTNALVEIEIIKQQSPYQACGRRTTSVFARLLGIEFNIASIIFTDKRIVVHFDSV